MAASRSPSPGGSPEPNLLLSPKSRMEARLAAMDTSSEEEDDEPLPVQRRKRTPPPTDTQTEIASDADSEDDIRPRGRLAARMQGGPSNNRTSLSPSSPQTQKTTQDASQEDAEDDNDLPVAPRRLKQRQARDTVTPPPQSPSAKTTPGLFVSSPPPAQTQVGNADNSDSDQEFPALKNDRFKALVERKRAERLAREAEEEEKRQERLARQAELDAQILEDDDGNASGITDDEGGLKLTQGARPTRKAGKKAIEEMNRETQRMARNMQLAHEAKTRKKISKASLFERFNFRTGPSTDAAPVEKTASSSRPTSPASAPHSDVEMGDAETPPSSPPVDTAPKETESTQVAPPADEDEELPALDEALLTATQAKIDKGKGKAIDSPPKLTETKVKPKRQFRVKLPQISANLAGLGSDDELEITTTRKNKLDAVFDRIPEKQAKETNSLHALRMLAQVKSPGKGSRAKGDRSTMTPGELQAMLHQRARQQAKLERERRMEMLKAKGIVVQTEEEREREMQDVEDIVSKARKEVEEIMEREREAAKEERRNKIKNGELDPLAWDDSDDDDDYEGSDEGQADAENEELELSGSEDENAEADDASDAEKNANSLIDQEASEDDAESNGEDKDSDEETELPMRNVRRPKKHVQIISDDEDEDAIIEATPKPKTTVFDSPAAPNTKSPAAPTSVLRSARKNFIPGLPVAGPAGLGLTQIFAGTMDDSQAGPASGASMQSPMPSFGGFPNFDNMSQDDTQVGDDMILDSQGGDTQKAPTQAEETQGVQLHYTQSQIHGFDSLLRDSDDFNATQMSFEPSQDGGLGDYTPLRERFIEPPVSTAQTAVLDQAGEDGVQESPLVRRGKLRRKIESIPEGPASTAEVPASFAQDNLPPTNTAFGIMADAARKDKKRKDKAEYNKKKSKAKGMFEEQAEESEDEYAGLGGADGEDDSDDDDVASVKEMIDDEGGHPDDERKIAALYADRERARDEQMVDKLFHDITSGALRRKRGADYDLSDSDDGGEARRRMKRRQFAKMQKALFADERIKKIAEKPGNQAFMRTLEDRESDDEMDFLDIGPEPMDTEESQTASQDQTVPDSQPNATAGRHFGPSTATNRRPANERRTKNGKKPSNISEIRESVSSLLEEPNALIIPATEVGSDGEMDDENPRPSTSHSNKENASPGKNPRRTAAKPAIIDRMSLKRQSSSNLSATSKVAFAMPSGTGSTGFKVPALLRRATTNSLASATSSSSTGTSTSASRFGDEGKIKRTAGKKSGVSALARETERRAALQENEKRREAKKWKGAERRGRAVGGLFGAGKFE